MNFFFFESWTERKILAKNLLLFTLVWCLSEYRKQKINFPNPYRIVLRVFANIWTKYNVNFEIFMPERILGGKRRRKNVVLESLKKMNYINSMPRVKSRWGEFPQNKTVVFFKSNKGNVKSFRSTINSTRNKTQASLKSVFLFASTSCIHSPTFLINCHLKVLYNFFLFLG